MSPKARVWLKVTPTATYRTSFFFQKKQTQTSLEKIYLPDPEPRRESADSAGGSAQLFTESVGLVPSGHAVTLVLTQALGNHNRQITTVWQGIVQHATALGASFQNHMKSISHKSTAGGELAERSSLDTCSKPRWSPWVTIALASGFTISRS